MISLAPFSLGPKATRPLLPTPSAARQPCCQLRWWWFSHKGESTSLVTPQTVGRQAPLSMGFSRQESWSGFPLPSLGDLPDPGINPGSAFEVLPKSETY